VPDAQNGSPFTSKLNLVLSLTDGSMSVARKRRAMRLYSFHAAPSRRSGSAAAVG